MAQQMKANVLIYTETNRSFIEEKVYDEFRYECLKDQELKDIDVDKMVAVLRKIYDFGEANPHMAHFFHKAPINISNFISEKYKITSETEDLVIDIGKLLDIIFACIDGGFASDLPNQPLKQQPKTPQNAETKEVIQEQINVPQEKVKKFYVPKPKTPEKKNFIQKYEMPEKKMPARYLMHVGKQVQKQLQVPSQPQVQPLDGCFIEKNRAALQARLQDLYQHYCAQQQNLGQHTTFDRIKEECSRMTLGKFLLFCKVSKIFQEKHMTRETLISKFKKIASGKKDIEFAKFKQLLALTDEEYISMRRRSMGEGVAVPTYEARLMLQGLDYKKLKRDVDLPFYTREKEGRELKQYSTVDSNRYVKREQLTSHSGKFGKDLKQEIQRKLVSQSQAKKEKQQRRSLKSPLKSKVIRLDSIRHEHIQEMEWLIEQDESDRIFMKEYRPKDVVEQLKKRVHDLEKLQRGKIF